MIGWIAMGVSAWFAGWAQAADYVSLAEGPVIFYDAPSTKAKKLFVGSRYLPLEQVVSLDTWVKVRDGSGQLAWVERRMLSSKRFLVATGGLVTARSAADAEAAVVFQLRQQVAVEWLEDTGTGWIKVRHTDGAVAYVKASEVWGN